MCRSGAGTCPCPNQMVNGNFTFNFPNGSSLLFGADGARLLVDLYGLSECLPLVGQHARGAGHDAEARSYRLNPGLGPLYFYFPSNCC